MNDMFSNLLKRPVLTHEENNIVLGFEYWCIVWRSVVGRVLSGLIALVCLSSSDTDTQALGWFFFILYFFFGGFLLDFNLRYRFLVAALLFTAICYDFKENGEWSTNFLVAATFVAIYSMWKYSQWLYRETDYENEDWQ